MFRKRLKVRTGCERCKRRRIKCDERHPVCTGCQRWGFNCVWPQPDSRRSRDRDQRASSDENIMVESEKGMQRELPLDRVAPTKPRILSNGYKPFDTQAQFVSTMTAVPLTLYSVRPEVAERFRDISVVNTIAVQEDWVRHAMAAFSTLVTSRAQKHTSQTAIEYYAKGCLALRSRVMSEPGEYSDVGLPELIASIYLGLFEATGSGFPLAALIHFTAAAFILAKLMYLNHPNTAFIKIAAEFSLYYISCLSLLVSEYDDALIKLDTSVFERILAPSTDPVILPHENSPYMSGNYEIHLLVLRITVFARSNYSWEMRSSQAKEWRNQLQQMEVDCVKYYRGLPTSTIQMLTKKTQLYVHALQMIVLKIGNPNARATDATVKMHLRAGIETLPEITLKNHAAQVLCWPLLILLCGATSSISIQILDEKLKSIISILDPGHRSWQAAALDRIKEHQKLKAATHDNDDIFNSIPDALDLLVQPKGLLGR